MIREMIRGFNFWGNDVFLGYAEGFTDITLADMQRIRSWGFNTVKTHMFWTYDIEPDETKPGVYNEAKLARLDRLVQDARTAGLYVIISVRVCFDPVNMPFWAGWSTHDYVLFNQKDSAGWGGLDRYAQMWSMLVNRYDGYDNVIGYMIWNYPLHGQNNTPDRANAFYDVVVPRLISTVRAKSNKIIFFSPIHKGMRGYWDEAVSYYVYDTYWYLNDPNDYVRKVNDPLNNLVYVIDDYGFGPVSSAEREWDYDTARLEQQLAGAKAFSQKYGVQFLVDEGGVMRPHSQSQLDMVKAMLTLRETFPGNWLWSDYSGPEDVWGIYEDREKTVESPLIPILREYPPIPTPISPLRVPLTLLGLGTIYYIIKQGRG